MVLNELCDATCQVMVHILWRAAASLTALQYQLYRYAVQASKNDRKRNKERMETGYKNR
jgi:hypothetical protein